MLGYGAASRIRARLENGPEPMVWITIAQGGQGLRHGSWMMAEIIDYLYAARFATNFLTPGDAFKRLESVANGIPGNAIKLRCRNCHGGVANVELANERYLELLLSQSESRPTSGIGDITNLRRAINSETHFNNLGQALVGNFATVGIVTVQQDHSVLRHDAQEMTKTAFDLVEIVKNIGMIELNIVHDHELGQVMNEL